MTEPKISILLVALLAMSCSKHEAERGDAPPPIATTVKGLCDGGGGEVGDHVSEAFFPKKVAGFCVDPNGETRAYGVQASGTLDQVCTQVFDGECESYKHHGLERAVTLRYAAGDGSPSTVSVTLTSYRAVAGAYGFYTQRVVAGADPLQAAPQPLQAGGAGALGTGIAYLWRGKYVAELSYANELESPAKIESSSARVLVPIAQALGERLPGDKAPPAAVARLPGEHRISQGVSFDPEDVLGIVGTGPGAVGYYKSGKQRWRVLSIVRDEEAAAQDVMKTFARVAGARRLKKPIRAIRLVLPNPGEGPPERWLVGRKGDRVVGVGSEPLLPAAAPQLDDDALLDKLAGLL